MARSTVSKIDRKDLRAHWDAAANGWNSQSYQIRLWLGDATKLMLDMADVRAGMRVLDVAAGAGDQSCDIANRVRPGGTVLVTDLSRRMLDVAETNLRAAGHENATTLIAEAENLGLDGSNFDAAVCRLGLMFLSHPLRGLQGVRRALRPGGRFGAMVFSEPSRNPSIAIIFSVAARHAGLSAETLDRPGGLMSLSRPGLIAGLFEEAGFVDIEVKRINAPFKCRSIDQYLAFVQTAAAPIANLLSHLDEKSRKTAWAEITDELACFASSDGWEAPTQVLIVTGAR